MKTFAVALAVLLLTVGFVAFAADGMVPQDPALTPIEQLGKELFFDDIAEPDSMSCAACHAPETGFSGPTADINLHGAVYPGSIPERFGNRRPPTAAYATWSPVLHFDKEEGLFIGGNFWDGRATGEELGNPAADQALGPFLNPVEHNASSAHEVVRQVAGADYATLWEAVWGEPIRYDTPNDVSKNFDRVGLAIAAYEASREVNQFSSKFDAFWDRVNDAGLDARDINVSNWRNYDGYGLSSGELRGLALFNDEEKGKCALCHVLDPVTDAAGNEWPPLFTDFSFDNLGVPRNPENPFYEMDTVFLDDGSPINPDGDSWVDPGLGGFLETRPEWRAMAPENYGKHKVPTLRNVARWPEPGEPGGVPPKSFMHNGVFKSLKEVVRFYNTRDVTSWPPPEVAENVNADELGNLGLSDAEETLIVIFMRTLSDGYSEPRKPAR